MTEQHDHDARISSLEVKVDHLSEQLAQQTAGISSAFKDMRTEISDLGDRLAHSISDLRKRHVDSQRPNVSAWIGFAGILLVIVGMVGSGYVRDANRTEVELDTLSAAFVKHSSDGHPTIAMQRIDALHELVHKQRETTKEEFILRDGSIHSEIEALRREAALLSKDRWTRGMQDQFAKMVQAQLDDIQKILDKMDCGGH